MSTSKKNLAKNTARQTKCEPTTHIPNVVCPGGPFAIHDMACAVHHQSEKAVLELNEHVFHPSWKARGDGWRLVRLGKWQLRLLKLLRITD